eukprot:gene2702-3280_t
MQVFAVNYISNAPLIVLVQQSAIPISMVVSSYFLRARYTTAQYAGAAVVLCGIIVVLVPNFYSSHPKPVPVQVSPTDATHSVSEIFWIIVLISSCIPMCMSSVYKEKALGEIDIDVVFLNGWVAVFQSIIAVPLCFPSASIINLPYDQILPNMYGGMLCWAGINTIHEATDIYKVDNCAYGPYFVSGFLFFNVVYNLLIIIVLKYGSANILWMASTVIVPLSNVAFSLDFMPGHRPLRTWDLIGLGVIMSGLVLYRFFGQISSLVHHLKDKISEEELEAEEEARIAGKQAEKKQLIYMGVNQVESLQTFIDARVMKEQKVILFRSPKQIRGSLLLRLGIPPSPQVTIAPARYGSSTNTVTMSPAVLSKQPIMKGTVPMTLKKRLSETDL